MRKNFSKLIAVALAIVLCLSIGSAAAFAANDGMTLTVSSVTADPGETVDVNIDLSGNVGIASLKFDVRYDSMLTLDGVTLCDYFTYATTPEPYKNPQTISMMSPLVETTDNGTVATLSFKVSADAPAGYKAKITLTYDADDIFDGNMDNVDCTMVEGTVTVAGSSYTSHITGITNGVAEVGDAAKITVETDLSVTKLQFVYSDGSTITLNKRVVSGNRKLWTLEKKYKEGVYSYKIREKVNEVWNDSGKVASLTFNAKPLKSGTAASAEYDEATGLYKVKVNGEAIKLQFITPDGLTRTYAKSHEAVKSVSSNGDGTEVWLVAAKLHSGVDYTVAAKFSAGWNYTDTASVTAK